MALSPEEKQKIEEEEKFRAEARQKQDKPKKKGISTGMGCLVIVLFFIIAGVIMSAIGGSKNTPTTPPTTTTTTNQTAVNTNTQTKAEAQKELDDLMALSKRADLVTSYEFSDKASVVYIGPNWYVMSVLQKKDFLAKVAMLKETITGYHHFEARDGQSNEKVGEVTAFSGSIEVYK